MDFGYSYVICYVMLCAFALLAVSVGDVLGADVSAGNGGGQSLSETCSEQMSLLGMGEGSEI